MLSGCSVVADLAVLRSERPNVGCPRCKVTIGLQVQLREAAGWTLVKNANLRRQTPAALSDAGLEEDRKKYKENRLFLGQLIQTSREQL